MNSSLKLKSSWLDSLQQIIIAKASKEKSEMFLKRKTLGPRL